MRLRLKIDTSDDGLARYQTVLGPGRRGISH